jgi:hypothetical protein
LIVLGVRTATYEFEGNTTELISHNVVHKTITIT